MESVFFWLPFFAYGAATMWEPEEAGARPKDPYVSNFQLQWYLANNGMPIGWTDARA